MSIIIPRGPEWNRRALKAPDDAVAWHASGFVQAVPTGTEGIVVSETVRPGINGRRVSFLVFIGSIASLNWTWRFYRNGNPYDGTIGRLRIGASVVPQMIPVFAVYEAGDLMELAVLNETGANRDAALYAGGWEF